MTVTPWWDTLTLRDEVIATEGGIRDLQVSLYKAVYEGDAEYGDVSHYSDITHPTPGLVHLLASVALRLGSAVRSEAAKAVWRGDQGMGGGKSHALVGLYHMATRSEEFSYTDLGQRVWARAAEIVGHNLPADLREPVTVVLSCDEMTPYKPDKDIDGPATTLGERWLWRLSEEDMTFYRRYRDRLETPSGITDAIEATGRPVLMLVDEVLNYIRKATARGSQQQDLTAQDLAFLVALMDATTKSDNAALVIVAISSSEDVVTMTDFGEKARQELEGNFNKYASLTATTSGGDFAEIIRRRLFTSSPPVEVTNATADRYLEHATGAWQSVMDKFRWSRPPDFRDAVSRSYPFHPTVVDLIEREWSQYAGFQKVRSTITIFAGTIWALQRRARRGGWVPLLVGLGDMPLSDSIVREAALNAGVIQDSSTIQSYREIAQSDIVDAEEARGAARQADLERSQDLFAHTNPRVAERMATALFVYSRAARTRRRGRHRKRAEGCRVRPGT